MSSIKKTFSNTNTGDKHPEPYLEANTENIPTDAKIKSLGYFFERAPIVMVSTIHAETDDLVSRCMGLANKEATSATLYLYTNTESAKNQHIVNDPRVNVAFLIPASGEWASVSGDATIVTDRTLVSKYYKPSLKTWFGDLKDGVHDGSAKDPRIGLLKVVATRASYAIVEEDHLGMKAETYEHTGDGKIPRINRQGTILREEFEAHRKNA